MGIIAGNERAVIEEIFPSDGKFRIRLARSKLRGKKKATTEIKELHFCKNRQEFTYWPNKWGQDLRKAVESHVVSSLV